MDTKHVKFTLKDAEHTYNLAMSMFRREDRYGFNINIVKQQNTLSIACMPNKGNEWRGSFILVQYRELIQLIEMNLDRQIIKKEAINKLHKVTNERIRRFKYRIDSAISH